MKQIPLQAVANQSVSADLGGQNARINIYERSDNLYCDVYVDNTLVIGGVICQNLNRIVRNSYLGFIGDLGFFDTQGVSDPDYTGLASRFVFVYLEASDFLKVA